MAYRDSASSGSTYTVVQSSAQDVATTNNASTTITSINLTAGTWAISANLCVFNTAAQARRAEVGISTASATFQGNLGSQIQRNGTGSGVSYISSSIGNFIVTLGTSTTYYLIGRQDFSSGTGTLNGRITAIRIA
jgi:hypothetical protein